MDLNHFNADPDPALHFEADPDPNLAFHFSADPDPDHAPHQSESATIGLQTLQGSILSLQASIVTVSVQDPPF